MIYNNNSKHNLKQERFCMYNIFKKLLLIIFVTTCIFGCSNNSNDVNKILTSAVKEFQNSQWQNALNLANQAVNIDKHNVNALLFRSIAAQKCNDNNLAIDSATQALKINPDNFVALYTLGYLYSQDNMRSSEALTLLEKANSIKPNDRNTLILLSNLAIKLNSSKAMTYLNNLSKVDGALVETAPFANMLGNAYWQINDKKTASTYFVKAYKLEKNNPVLAYNLAIALDFFFKREKSAIPYYKSFIALTKNNPAYQKLIDDVNQRIQTIK